MTIEEMAKDKLGISELNMIVVAPITTLVTLS